jgi:hypothetical protein
MTSWTTYLLRYCIVFPNVTPFSLKILRGHDPLSINQNFNQRASKKEANNY